MDALKLHLPWLMCIAMVIMMSCIFISPVDSCSCGYVSRRALFCLSEFVVKAIVREDVTELDDDINPMLQDKKYTIEIVQELRGDEKFQNAGKEFVLTPYSESICGITLKPDTEYLLSGRIRNNELWVGLCDWNKEWNKLNGWEKRGVLDKYQDKCAKLQNERY